MLISKIFHQIEKDLKETQIELGRLKDQADSLPYARYKGQLDILRTYHHLIRELARNESLKIAEPLPEPAQTIAPTVPTYFFKKDPNIKRKDLVGELKQIMEAKK